MTRSGEKPSHHRLFQRPAAGEPVLVLLDEVNRCGERSATLLAFESRLLFTCPIHALCCYCMRSVCICPLSVFPARVFASSPLLPHYRVAEVPLAGFTAADPEPPAQTSGCLPSATRQGPIIRRDFPNLIRGLCAA